MKINGSLVFDASSSSEVQNLRIQKYANLAAVPTYTSADAGRLVYTTDTGTIYYGSSTLSAWLQLASGGTAFSQTEGDAIETTLGAGINSDGTLNAAGFDSPISSAASFTDAINQLAAYATANNTLAELDDVNTTGAVTGDFLQYNGSTWVDHTLVLADVTNVTATAAEVNELASAGAVNADFVKLHAVTASAAELNILDGATLTTTELNFVDGVTSSIQGQLDNKQGLDATLTALAALDTTAGIVVQTGTDTFTKRTLQAPAAGIIISNPAGIAGDPTFALANDLAALEGLTTTGYVIRTGDGTATTRAVTGTSGNIDVTNGDGVASDTSINLATVSQAASGNFVKVTLDGFGRVTGNTAVVAADITSLVDSAYVNVTGDTMTGSLTMSGAGVQVVLPNAPTAGTHATNKNYVDALSQGLSWKLAVRAATTGNVDLSTDLEATDTVDGVTLVAGDRVLVKSQTLPEENGIYIVQASGAAVRSLDLDSAAEFSSATVFVQQGTANADTGWTQTAEVTTVGTDSVTWVQFTGAGTYSAGLGLVLSGNTFNVNFGAGIAQLPSDEVGVDLFDAATGAIILTTDGTARSTGSAAQLHLLLKATNPGLTQDVNGLYIGASQVLNSMLANSTVGLNADSGTSTLALGQTLQVTGNSTQGIVTAVTGQTVNVTASDASTTQKGVASFSSGWFEVDNGNVEIAPNSISNSELLNSAISFTGTDASTDEVNLGETLTFVSGAAHTGGPLVKVVVDANNATFTVREATSIAPGVASFSTDHFTITGSDVTLNATLDDLANVSSADLAATGDLLTKTAGDWQNVTRAAVVGSTSIDAHNDVDTTTTTPADGHALVFNGTNWVNQPIFYLHTQGSAATTWTVTHSLGQKYCNVTVVDSTDNVIIPQSIVFDTTSQLTVTFNTSVSGKVVVMGIA